MKFLLAAVNAKYIHSNLGVYSLKKYADEKRKQQGTAFSGPDWEIEIGEYTINHQMDYILQDIYEKAPDAVGFSCYIWNILYVQELIRDLKKVLPQTEIWLGGPEVSYRVGIFKEGTIGARRYGRGRGGDLFPASGRCKKTGCRIVRLAGRGLGTDPGPCVSKRGWRRKQRLP